jgi:hypothetical protein
MARQRNDEAELTRCVTVALDVVDGALPQRGSDHDRTELRKIAFTAVLRELLDSES